MNIHFVPPRTLHLTLVLLSVVTLLATCRKRTSKKAPTDPVVTDEFSPIAQPLPSGTNLLLIVIDTQRADRLGCYGYDQPTSPTIDQFAEEGILFERFYASSPWTAPSFGTMYTGMSPRIHHTGRWLREKPPGTIKIGVVRMYPLNRNLVTLAEKMTETRNAAFTSNPFMDPIIGFARGFHHYDHTAKYRRADDITDNAMQWIEQNARNPFFAVVHYMDPHAPYDPPEPYRQQFATGDPGRMKVPFNLKLRELRNITLTKEELAFVTGLYNAEVRFVDDQIKRLLEHLQTLSLMDNTWIIITSDHGEEHGEHGGFYHAQQYEDEVTRVPLIIRAPGGQWGAGRRIPYAVPMQDLFPTILELFQLELPEPIEGKSILPILRGEEQEHRPCYMEYQLLGKHRYAWFDGRYKIIKSEIDAEVYMYDLEEDPQEQRKLTTNHPEFVRMLSAMESYRRSRVQLEETIGRHPTDKPQSETDDEDDDDSAPALSDESLEALKALGYIE